VKSELDARSSSAATLAGSVGTGAASGPPPSPSAPVPSDGTPPTSPGASPGSSGTLPEAAPVPTDPASVAALLERASSSDFTGYDPRAVIDAVNALVALGADDAWGAVEASLTGADLVTEPRRGLFLVLRTAFDADLHPPVMLGTSDPPPPTDAGVVPRFPLVLVDDVPILLVSRYAAGGVVEPVTAHVAHYRASGTLRARALAPGTDADRMAAVTALYRAAYHVDPSPAVCSFVEDQLRRAGLLAAGPHAPTTAA
jgi:hypothetical protein